MPAQGLQLGYLTLCAIVLSTENPVKAEIQGRECILQVPYQHTYRLNTDDTVRVSKTPGDPGNLSLVYNTIVLLFP